MHFISIDCGASFLKAAMFCAEGETVYEYIQSTRKFDKNKYVIDSLVSEITIFLKKCFSMVDDKDFSIGISNEMHGFVLTDMEGNAIIDYMSWQNEDSKKLYQGKSYLQLLKEKVSDDVIMATGMPLKAGLPSTNLFYLIKSGQIKFKKYDKLRFYTLGDYIIRSVSNQEPVCHPTNAAATGLYDLNTQTWNSKLLEVIECDNIIFPQISHCKKLVYEYEDCKIEILPAIGDQQAALYGAGLQKNMLSCNFGTGAQISVLTDEPECSKEYQIRPFFDDLYIRTIPHIPSGRAINVYYRFVYDMIKRYDANVTDDRVWQIINEAVKETQSFNKKYPKTDLSFFSNAITEETEGNIKGITEDNFYIGQLFMGVFTQIAENALEIIKRLNVENISKIIFTGGVVRRISIIRDKISICFPDIENVLVENETLRGLYLYQKKYQR